MITEEERLNPPQIVFQKPPWFDNVREEYNACRERVGIIDMSSFAKFHLKVNHDVSFYVLNSLDRTISASKKENRILGVIN